MRIRLGLRPALLLALLPVLLLPWIGLYFVGQMAELTRDERREGLAGAARSFAAVLHERPDLFALGGASELPADATPLVAGRLKRVVIDGNSQEWAPVVRHAVPSVVYGDAPEKTLRVRLAAARIGDAVHDGDVTVAENYLLIQVDDERFVARREGSTPSRTRAGDAVLLWAGAQHDTLKPVPIEGISETSAGWFVELALPPTARFIRVRIDDVDYQASRKIEATADSGLLLITGSPGQLDSLKAQVEQRQKRQWDDALAGFVRSGIRVATYSDQGSLLAMRGDFGATPPAGGWLGTAARRLLAWAVKTGAGFKEQDEANSRLASIASALRGLPAGFSARLSRPSGEPFWVISQAHPVWVKDRVAGALLIEQGSNSDLATGQSALEWLALLSAVAIIATLLSLLGMASLLVSRIVRLKVAAESAIDSRGRVVGSIPHYRLGDEISELAASYENVLSRLREHQHYLANLRSRLVHELRTPIMVVRSSLENLQDARADAGGASSGAEIHGEAFVKRALSGATRLEQVVSSMSEAASLESLLEDSQLEQVDLVSLLQGLTNAYNQIYGGERNSAQFELVSELDRAECMVVPETIAQALDKLAANAVDFAQSGTPITIEFSRRGDFLDIAVMNLGPALPEIMAQSLFESMVSVRGDAARDQSHLGLGLYLVRLIAEFHGGQAYANNVPGGVRIGFTIEATE